MIYLGLTPEEKAARICAYCAEHGIGKVYLLTPRKFAIDCGVAGAEIIEWAEIIEYKFFYRLLQEIDASALVVVNECLRLQNRYDLTYNCIRHFLNQARHQLVFQWLPFIEDMQDFMILFDFDTRSRWKRERFSPDLLAECGMAVEPRPVAFAPLPVEADATLRDAYQREKDKLFAGLGGKDPHTIPRNLYLMSGKARMQRVEMGPWYVGRNTRLKLDRLRTYKEDAYPDAPYTVFEFPHNFIDFADVSALSGQTRFEALVADLPVDRWYFERYTQWSHRLEQGYADLLGRTERP